MAAYLAKLEPQQPKQARFQQLTAKYDCEDFELVDQAVLQWEGDRNRDKCHAMRSNHSCPANIALLDQSWKTSRLFLHTVMSVIGKGIQSCGSLDVLDHDPLRKILRQCRDILWENDWWTLSFGYGRQVLLYQRHKVVLLQIRLIGSRPFLPSKFQASVGGKARSARRYFQ